MEEEERVTLRRVLARAGLHAREGACLQTKAKDHDARRRRQHPPNDALICADRAYSAPPCTFSLAAPHCDTSLHGLSGHRTCVVLSWFTRTFQWRLLLFAVTDNDVDQRLAKRTLKALIFFGVRFSLRVSVGAVRYRTRSRYVSCDNDLIDENYTLAMLWSFGSRCTGSRCIRPSMVEEMCFRFPN